ncbi:MAG: urea ABC transporter ATP-binding subunit UrtE [Actinomycetota bacterium]|nr:urea ABC transporter ATP-binding subunit UrtE [Actinomycetota bacterium]
MLAVRDLSVFYGSTQVLFDVCVEVPDGSVTCILGRNGVGKTTLLNAVMGVLPAASGSVVFGDRDLSRLPAHERVRLGLGYAPAGQIAFPRLSVLENLLVVVESAGASGRSRLDEVLALFPRLVPMLQRPAGLLSGGQRQQLAMARALVAGPSLLVLDEPTEGIQPSIVLEMEDAIAELHRSRRLSILLVEQYVDFALRLADAYVVMEAGRVVATGETASAERASLQQLLAV